MMTDADAQTDVSFASRKFKTFIGNQDELNLAFDKLNIRLRLDNVLSREGSAVLTKRNYLTETVSEYKFENTDDMKAEIFKQSVTFDNLKEDFVLILTTYMHQMKACKEKTRLIETLQDQLGIWKNRQQVYYDALQMLDQECSDIKEKYAAVTAIHSKCKLNAKVKFMSTKKRRKNVTKFSNDKGIFNDYLTALTEVNMRILEMPVTKPFDAKYYYIKVHNFFESRLDFIKKRTKVDPLYQDQPFTHTFYYETLNLLCKGGKYSPEKLKGFMHDLLRCQINPKILILCKSLGLIEGEQFGVALQRRYTRYLWLLSELREGQDIPVNYEACTQ